MSSFLPTKNTNWKNYFKVLEDFVSQYGWKVKYYKIVRSQALLAEKTINLQETKNIEKTFYTLLHEVGHAVVYSDVVTYYKRYKHINRSHYGTIGYRINVIEEEVAAWQVAEDLADKLSLPFNQKNFDSEKYHCLKSYVEWMWKINRKGKKNVKPVNSTTDQSI
jgi:hypothetical protein